MKALHLALWCTLLGCLPLAQADELRSFCPPEIDTTSPRHTWLKSTPPNAAERVLKDVDADGDPDVLECWWNGKRVRWLDENDDMKSTDLRGDLVNDCLQIDMDGDGFYDGPGDINVKWVDSDGDGMADLQIVAINPALSQKKSFAGTSHYMVFQDVDRDGVLGYFNWTNFDFACWRISGGNNFSPDYMGNSIFLKDHNAPYAFTDPRLSWENPFAFYDFDNDGCTEMAVRFCDDRKLESADASKQSFDAWIEHAYVTFDVDNDTQRGNEMDYDMTLLFEGGPGFDYHKFRQRFANMKAPAWVLQFFRFTNWRENDELVFVPHNRCYAEMFKHSWGSANFVFDEDDDDHRWERVELYYPGDPYNTKRGGQGTDRSIAWHPQADSLGDRGEWDKDFSGRGKLYVTRWDGKIHLLGAESGAWTVDRNGEYWGAGPVHGTSSPKNAPKVGEVVQYRDTDGNGFFDEITFDYDGDRAVDLRVSLLEFATTKNPHPDQAEVIDPAKERWEGLHRIFIRISNQAWTDALKLYRAAWKRGLTGPELDDLAIASSVAERYDHAYWLKETIVRSVLKTASESDRKTILRLYYTGDFDGLAKFIATMLNQ